MYFYKNIKFITIILGLLFTILLILLLYIDGNESIRANGKDKSEEISSDKKYEKASYINLYDIYYSINSKDILKTLSDKEIDFIENGLAKMDLSKVFSQENLNINLYDIWLYTQITKKLGIELNYKEEIIDYLSTLSNGKGYYKSSSSEGFDLSPSSYLLTTKMAIEIYVAYGEPIPEVNETKNYLKTLCELLLEEVQDIDFISLGDYLVMIQNISEYSSELNINEEFVYKSLVDYVINNIFVNDVEHIQEFTTLINIGKTFNINLPGLDIKFENYMNSVQLSDGSFPIYGQKGELSDILTTYLFINNSNELGVPIPNLAKLNLYLSNQID